jgi:hypothetical protein
MSIQSFDSKRVSELLDWLEYKSEIYEFPRPTCVWIERCPACDDTNTSTTRLRHAFGDFETQGFLVFCFSCHWDTVIGDRCIATYSTPPKQGRCRQKGFPYCRFHKMQFMDGDIKKHLMAELKNEFGDVFDWLKSHRDQIEHRANRNKTSVVYFIQADKYVKIGTSTRLEERLKTIRRGEGKKPHDCDTSDAKLLGTISGRYAEEADLHKRFAKWRVAGEWFVASPQLLSEIGSLTGFARLKVAS